MNRRGSTWPALHNVQFALGFVFDDRLVPQESCCSVGSKAVRSLTVADSTSVAVAGQIKALATSNPPKPTCTRLRLAVGTTAEQTPPRWLRCRSTRLERERVATSIGSVAGGLV